VVEERIEAPRMKGINDFWGKLSAPQVCPNFIRIKDEIAKNGRKVS
jgi:hypothetical protein